MCMANALWAQLDRVVYGATIEDASRYVHQIHIHAKEVARRSDMHCVVEGPVLRDLCVTLFTHPKMQKAFRSWPTRKDESEILRVFEHHGPALSPRCLPSLAMMRAY